MFKKYKTEIIGAALCLFLGMISGYSVSGGDSLWYSNLVKPSFNPPSFVFGPVWSLLYIMMGIAGAKIWAIRRQNRALFWLFILQLALNLIWSPLFFYYNSLDLALYDIFALLLSLIMIIYLSRGLKIIFLLLLPYLLWVSFASLLTFSIYQMNGTNQKISFWNQERSGANIFNQKVTREDIKAAKAYGIEFIRLAPDKFITKNQDFLIGDADNYQDLSDEDLQELKKLLDIFAEEKMPVILTMLSLPGSRWKQNNHNIDDLRLWDSEKFQNMSARFWGDLAFELKDHPAIIGYNILNEPHLEKIYNSDLDIQQKLNAFYELIIAEIRSVDPKTPIILDSSSYADAKAFKLMKQHSDPYILYSFHHYEPYEYTNQKTNQGRFSYPGKIGNRDWDKEALESYMQDVVDFQNRYDIPSNRILVGEFGGHRSSGGLPEYFTDLIQIFKKNHWHFAFYAFREDTWDGMDYELGDKKLPWKYWEALEKGENPKLDRKASYPQFKVLIDAMNGTKTYENKDISN